VGVEQFAGVEYAVEQVWKNLLEREREVVERKRSGERGSGQSKERQLCR